MFNTCRRQRRQPLPLSRKKNYPKQFMNIKEGRSLLQETVVRNMPFCDEFIIVTKESYRNIVNGSDESIPESEVPAYS